MDDHNIVETARSGFEEMMAALSKRGAQLIALQAKAELQEITEHRLESDVADMKRKLRKAEKEARSQATVSGI